MDYLSPFQLSHIVAHLAPIARFRMHNCHHQYEIRYPFNGSGYSFLSCCTQGNIRLIKSWDDTHGANWDEGLCEACRAGHREVVDLMIAKGANCWSHGLYWACQGGNRDIVDLIIAKGCTLGWSGKYRFLRGGYYYENARIWSMMYPNVWDRGLIGACYGGHREIVDLMITKGANNWNQGLNAACQGGHREIVELMIARGADNWNMGLLGACRGGHLDIVDLMVANGAEYSWLT